MTEPALTIVIVFDHASITGGASRVAFDSAIGLKAAGHRPIVFAAAGPVSPELAAAGIETVCLDQLDLLSNPSKVAAAVQGLWNIRAAEALGDLLAKLPPDSTIVHVHGWAKALSPSIATAVAKSKLPAVYTNHEYFQFCPNGGFYNYQKGHICTLKPLSASCWASNCDSRSYARKIWRNVRLVGAKHLAHIPESFPHQIAISDFQQDIIRPAMPPGTQLHRLDNPISVPDLGPRPRVEDGAYLFVGRLSPEKGALVFAEAARRCGIVPTFLGDGPVAADIAARYPEARMLGWQPAAAVQAAMRKARTLVFPSLWYEGQPLTVLEAKALGLPAIVSDACAASEEIADGVTGLLFRSADPDDLARCLRVMAEDAVVDAMSAAAYRDYWTAPRTLERHTHALTGIYRTMVEGACHASARAPAGAEARTEWAARMAAL